MTSDNSLGITFKRITIQFLSVSFVLVTVPGFAVFFHIGGHPLKDLHGWVGILFTLAASLHIYRKWRQIIACFSMKH